MKHVNNGRAFKKLLKFGNVLQKIRKKHKQILIASLKWSDRVLDRAAKGPIISLFCFFFL